MTAVMCCVVQQGRGTLDSAAPDELMTMTLLLISMDMSLLLLVDKEFEFEPNRLQVSRMVGAQGTQSGDSDPVCRSNCFVASSRFLQACGQESKSVLEIIQGKAGTAQQHPPASMEGVLPDAL